MNIKLIHYTPLPVASCAARTCTATEGRFNGLPTADLKLLKTLIKKGHESVLEHVYMTWVIDGMSRGCLQELVRHRIASYSVQSTRWTLRKLANQMNSNEDIAGSLVSTGNATLDWVNVSHLQGVIGAVRGGHPNDTVKTMLPEAFKTKAVVTMNLRSFRNFLNLRTAKNAHWEIRDLAYGMCLGLPEDIFELVLDVYHAGDES